MCTVGPRGDFASITYCGGTTRGARGPRDSPFPAYVLLDKSKLDDNCIGGFL